MKIWKWVGILVGLLVIAFAGALYYASTQIDAEKLRLLVIEQTQKIFPNSNVELESLDYSLGPSITFELKNFDLSLSSGLGGQSEKLFSFESSEATLPLWALLSSSGVMSFSIKSPKANFIETKDSNNWEIAMQGRSPQKDLAPNTKEQKKDSSEQTSPSIPEFLSNASADVRLENASLSYIDKNQKRSEVLLQKIIAKGIGPKSTMGFEIESQFSHEKDGKKSQASVLMVGDVQLPLFFEQQILAATMRLNVDSIQVDELPLELKKIVLDAEVNRGPGGKSSVSGKVSVNDFLKSSFALEHHEQQLNITSMQLEIFLSQLLSSLDEKLKGATESIDVAQASLLANGSLELDLNSFRLRPNVDFKLSSPVSLKMPGGPNVSVEAEGSYEKANALSLKLEKQLLQGGVTTRVSTTVNPLKLPEELSKYPPVKVSVIGSQLSISEEFSRNMMQQRPSPQATPSKTLSDKSKGVVKNKGKSKNTSEKIDFPEIEARVAIEQSQLHGKDFAMQGNFKVKGSRVSGENISLKMGQGSSTARFSTQLTPQAINNEFNLSMKQIDLSIVNPFLPEMLKGVSGEFQGSFEGNARLPEQGKLSYDVSSNLNAKDGELKGLNLSKFVQDLVSGVSLLKGKVKDDSLVFDDRFKVFRFVGRATQDLVNISAFKFIGVRNKIAVEGSGKVSMTPSAPSRVTLEVRDPLNKWGKELKEETGQDFLPLLLEGMGFSMSPNTSYTVKRLAKNAAKTQAQKQIDQKADEFIEKNIKNEKVKKLLKDKVNPKKLLKGLFN